MPYFDKEDWIFTNEVKEILNNISFEDLKNFNEKQTKEENFTDFEINEPTNQI